MAARSLERMRAALSRAQLAYGSVGIDAQADLSPLRFVALCRGALLGEITRLLDPAQIVCALSPKAALDIALADLADGIIIDSAVRDLRIGDFVETLRAHPGLSDMPVLVLAPAYEANALLQAGVDKVVHVGDLAASAETSGLARRSLRQLRQALRLAKAQDIREAAKEEAVIRRHIDIAFHADEPQFVMSLLQPRDGELQSILAGEPSITRALRQLLATLTRAEDIVLQFNQNSYVIIFPDISPVDADAILARLESVVRSSAFMRENGDVIQGLSLAYQNVSNQDFTDAAAMWDHAVRFLTAGNAPRQEA